MQSALITQCGFELLGSQKSIEVHNEVDLLGLSAILYMYVLVKSGIFSISRDCNKKHWNKQLR